jgi:hypothetical protein
MKRRRLAIGTSGTEDVMLRPSLIGPTLALGLMTSIAGGQGPAAPRSAPSPGRDYKVAFWYDADRPTSSIHYRVYDLARGEYDAKAVDRWLDLILSRYPDRGAYVRDIRTAGFPGATEADRLANAIDAEKARWAALRRTVSPPLPRLVSPLGSPGPRAGTVGRSMFDRPPPGSPGGLGNPPASPIPYPYRSRPL